jgi:hypothetical protein
MPYVDPRQVCAPWIAASDLCCDDATQTECDGSQTALTYKWTDDEIILAACNLLFARTCFRYPGVCSVAAYPCRDCSSCGDGCCGCGPQYRIELPSDYPILEVTAVYLDSGPAMNPALYRLDGDRWLVRLDGEPWPYANSFGDDTTGIDQFKVEYDTGRDAPQELKMAAAELACELKKACEGKSCGLPEHVSSVARRGVSYEIQDVTALLSDGLTGNPIIDHALKVHGNCAKIGQAFDPARRSRGWPA